jgi:predicted DNA-binding transcriptional regulator AlpA
MKHYLTSGHLKARFDKSAMTLHRWVNDDELGFPKPIYIRGRRYWTVESIEAWEKSRAAASASA